MKFKALFYFLIHTFLLQGYLHRGELTLGESQIDLEEQHDGTFHLNFVTRIRTEYFEYPWYIRQRFAKIERVLKRFRQDKVSQAQLPGQPMRMEQFYDLMPTMRPTLTPSL